MLGFRGLTTPAFVGGAVTNPLTSPNGSAAAPSYSFTNDTDTGIWLANPGANAQLSFAAAGINLGFFQGGVGGVGGSRAFKLVNQTRLIMGSTTDVCRLSLNDSNSASNPVLNFESDEDTGFYSISTNWFGVATAGVARWSWDANGNYICTIDNTYDLGTVGRRPRTVDVGTSFAVVGTKVIGAQGAAVADAAGGATVDAEARTAINALLARCRAHGLIAT